jgi:protein O-GlcNAc transferase
MQLLQTGVQLQQNGDHDGAERVFRRVLELDNANVHALNLLGLSALNSGNFEISKALIARALELNPVDPRAHNNLGVALKETSRLAESIPHFEQAVALDPNFAEAHANLGAALRASGNFARAAASNRRAVELEPQRVRFLLNLANSLDALRERDEAESLLRRALQLAPDDPMVLNALGVVLRGRGNPKESFRCFEKALALDPQFVDAINNMGTAYDDNGVLEKSIACFRSALALRPDSFEILTNLGVSLFKQGRTNEARAALKHALKIRHDDATRVKIALMLPVIYDSTEDLVAARLRQQQEFKALEEAEPSIPDPLSQVNLTNFYLAYQGQNDRDMQKQLARIFARACPSLLWTAPHCAPHKTPSRRSDGDPIRIGFVSTQLKLHSVGLAVKGLVAGLSRSRFSIVVFSKAVAGDPVSEFIQDSVTHFDELPDDLASARRKIASRQLDLLIYPDIGMHSITYYLSFARLAPVQCVMWGHGGTTGVGNLDYFISSAEVEPDDADNHYSERLVRIGRAAIPAFSRPQMPASPKPRAEFGLPEAAHLYVCPQSLFKLHPDFDAVIHQILLNDVEGRLILIDGEQRHWNELLNARFALSLSGCADRVIYVPRLNAGDFRNLLAVCDVMLDSIHVGGGMTTLDGLVAGTPIVTLPGKLMRGRFTAAWCRLLELDECVAESPAHYVELALRLAMDRTFHAKISGRIAANSHRLFDDNLAVHLFEEFFAAIAKDPLMPWSTR